MILKYKEFNEGDEVYTDKKNWKLIIETIYCYKMLYLLRFISDCDIRVVDIENESGRIVLSGTLVINLIKQLDKQDRDQ
jgi:hypothetical protein